MFDDNDNMFCRFSSLMKVLIILQFLELDENSDASEEEV